MTRVEASQLRARDRVRLTVGPLHDTVLTVATVRIFSGPMGTEGPIVIGVLDSEDRPGVITGDMIVAIEKLPGAPPPWYGTLMS